MTSLFPYGGESLTQKKMANGNILFHPVKKAFHCHFDIAKRSGTKMRDKRQFKAYFVSTCV